MRHLVTFCTFVLLLAGVALADDAKPAAAPKAPAGPCEHGQSRMMMGSVDPVEQSCVLAMAGQTITAQAQQIVLLQAQLAVAKNDLAAAQKAPAKPEPEKAEGISK